MVFFKRWSRKNYAIFNSLKREIKICTLNVCLHLNAPTLIREFVIRQNFALDDPPEEDDFLLSELEISQLTLLSNPQSISESSRSASLYKNLLDSTKTTFSRIPSFQHVLSFNLINRFLFDESNTRKGILLSNFS